MLRGFLDCASVYCPLEKIMLKSTERFVDYIYMMENDYVAKSVPIKQRILGHSGESYAPFYASKCI